MVEQVRKVQQVSERYQHSERCALRVSAVNDGIQIKMKKQLTQTLMGLQLIVVIALAIGAMWVGKRFVAGTASSAVASRGELTANQPGAALGPAVYGGKVALKITLGGVLSDTLATPTPVVGQQRRADVGSIDLGLFLSQSGNTMSGYVDLDHSLVFSSEHTIQATPMFLTPAAGRATPAPVALKTGPKVQGSYDGTQLTLQSEVFSLQVSGRTIQRQFRLIGTRRDANGNTFAGEYRETLWGYATVPLTVVGEFTLDREGVPLAALPNVGGGGNTSSKIFLPMAQR